VGSWVDWRKAVDDVVVYVVRVAVVRVAVGGVVRRAVEDAVWGVVRRVVEDAVWDAEGADAYPCWRE